MADDPMRARAAADVNEEFQQEQLETLQRQKRDTAELAGKGQAERNAFNRQRTDMEIAHAKQWQDFQQRKDKAAGALIDERNSIKGRLRSLTSPRYFERKEAALNAGFTRQQQKMMQGQGQQTERLDQQQQQARLRYGRDLKALRQQHRDERAGQKLRQESSREQQIQQKAAALRAEQTQTKTQTETRRPSRDFNAANDQGRSLRR